jgi:hypothetical protein
MIPAHQDFVSDTAKACKALLDQYGALQQLNVLWAGSPDYDALITQGEIDEVPSFAGLTATQLADAEFALASIKDTITNALPALTVLSNLP